MSSELTSGAIPMTLVQSRGRPVQRVGEARGGARVVGLKLSWDTLHGTFVSVFLLFPQHIPTVCK